MFGSFGRSWKIWKKTLQIIKKDNHLYYYPIASFFASFVFLIVIGALVISYVLFGYAPLKEISQFLSVLVYILILLIFSTGMTFISNYFSTGVVYTTANRFSGEETTFSEGLNFANQRFGNLFYWSAFDSVVGMVLRYLQEKLEKLGILGSLIGGLAGLAWTVSKTFVLQEIVYRDKGPFKALKGSVKVIKDKWGDVAVQYVSFGAIGIIMFIPGLILGGVLLALVANLGMTYVWIVLGLILLYAIAVGLTFGIASTIYSTALYVYANTGKVPEEFDKDSLENAFKPKKSKN
ncbi:MAG: DUF6159 family protein [Candidatus Pacearchaeota archaeon]